MPALVARSVRVRHDGAPVWAPDGLDAVLQPGEVLLVLGPSGCGKSTFALTLNGLIPHAVPAELQGEVVVGDARTADASVAELSTRVAMVFQDPDAQLVARTVLDEVCFGPENLRVPPAEIESRAERALRAVGLWERRMDDPAILSGGGKQRLAIACALALEAPILVLDEPTAHLDPVGAAEVYRLLRELTGPGSGRSVVLIEHDVDLALGIVDRVLVLDRSGRTVAHGPADTVLRERRAELERLGVWLPGGSATGGARRRRAARQSAPASQAAVSVEGLSVRRSGRGILHDVSLRVERGEFLAIVGPNGAGKSTLVQALAGVRRPPRGSVDLAGLDPATARADELAAAVGFVFQNPEHQFVAETVEAELAYGLRQRRRPEAEIASRVDRMLTTLGLQAQRSAHPFLLSGGQKRRLSVGTALIGGAPLLVLDEPTFGQDRANATELLDLLTELNEQGTTVIAVTHDLRLVAERAGRVAVVDGGRIVAVGDAAEILADTELLEAHGLRARPEAPQPPASEHAPSPQAPGGGPGGGGLLRRLNPLAVLAGLAPAAVGALFTRDAVVPLLLLCLSLGMLLVGVLLSVRQRMGLLLGLPVGVVLSAAGFSLWADGPLTHAVAVGVATALRLAALVSVALCAGLAVDGAELARALTAQLRIPYRFGYAAVAALRFVPRFAGESSAIRQAQRVRGGGAGRGPLTAVRNAAGTVVPLLASSIRHADRVALAMESRAFGAHATRTERRPSLWRVRDTLFVTAVWSATAAILLGPVVLPG